MKHTLSILVFVGILNVLYSEELRENNQEVLSLAVIPTEENQPGAGDETTISELSSSDLSINEELTKNISYLKRNYREGVYKKEVQRTVMKKTTISDESDVKKLLLRFQSAENKLLILQRLEVLVHQYDVAITFATMGGMKIISPYLYSNDDDIVSAVAMVLGSAMQSNPVVQKIAMDEKVGKKLLQLLNHHSPYVVPQIVFAISSFLKNAPKAQAEFFLAKGASRFADILGTPFITTDTKLKIVDLFNDLAIEQKVAKEKTEALQRIFSRETYENNICGYIVTYLELEDYDSHQRVVDAMLSLDSVCKDIFRLDIVKDRLEELLKMYYPGNSEKKPWYRYMNEELRETVYSRLVVLYEKVNYGANVSSYKYFSNTYPFKTEL